MIRSEILPDGRLASCLHDETTVMFMGEVARIERAGSAPEAAVAAKALGACILSECPLITFQQECPSPLQQRFDQLKDYVDAHRPPRIAPEVFAETIVLPDMHNETQVDTFLNQVAELTYLQIEQVRPHWYRTGMMRQPGLCAKTTAIMCHNLGRWGIESEPMYHAFPESHFYVRTTNLPENKDADLTWQQFLPQDDVNFDVPDTLIASSGGLAVAAIVYGVPEHAGRYWDDASPNPTDWREFRSSLLWEVIAPHEQHPEWLGP